MAKKFTGLSVQRKINKYFSKYFFRNMNISKAIRKNIHGKLRTHVLIKHKITK